MEIDLFAMDEKIIEKLNREELLALNEAMNILLKASNDACDVLEKVDWELGLSAKVREVCWDIIEGP